MNSVCYKDYVLGYCMGSAVCCWYPDWHEFLAELITLSILSSVSSSSPYPLLHSTSVVPALIMRSRRLFNPSIVVFGCWASMWSLWKLCNGSTSCFLHFHICGHRPAVHTHNRPGHNDNASLLVLRCFDVKITYLTQRLKDISYNIKWKSRNRWNKIRAKPSWQTHALCLQPILDVCVHRPDLKHLLIFFKLFFKRNCQQKRW